MLMYQLNHHRSMFNCLWVVSMLCSIYSMSAQDTTMHHLEKLPSDSSKLTWLSQRMTQTVLSDPASTYRIADIYDSLAMTIDYDRYQGRALSLYGMAYYSNGLYEQSADYYLQALEILENSGDLESLGQLYNNLATTYRFRAENSKSIEYYLKAMAIARQTNDKNRIAMINNNLGMQYVELEDYSSAQPHYNEAIELYGEIGQPLYQGIVHLSRGNLLIELESYSEAIEDYEEAMSLVPESAVPLLHAASIAGIGSSYNRMNQLNRAQPLLHASLDKALAINHTEQIKESNRELAELYEKKGNYKKALLHHKDYKMSSDEMLSTEQDQAMMDALTKYESEKNQQEIALLNSENEVTNLRLASSRKTSLISVLGSLMFAGLSFLMFRLMNVLKVTSKF